MGDDHAWEGMKIYEDFYTPAFDINGRTYSRVGLPINKGLKFFDETDMLLIEILKKRSKKGKRLLWILFKAKKLK